MEVSPGLSRRRLYTNVRERVREIETSCVYTLTRTRARANERGRHRRKGSEGDSRRPHSVGATEMGESPRASSPARARRARAEKVYNEERDRLRAKCWWYTYICIYIHMKERPRELV